MEYKFQRHRADKIPRSKLFEELEKAAKLFNYIEFGWRDFNKVADVSRGPVVEEFGSWRNALKALKEHLQSKQIELKPKQKEFISDLQLFREMGRIWSLLGHRPSRDEWEGASPQVSYSTYKLRFNGWQNACLKFIEYKMDGHVLVEEENRTTDNLKPLTLFLEGQSNPISRSVSLKLRLQVLSRDNFRCVLCGKSPATQMGVRLHIDHIVPFSKGGKTSLGNLQTLCYECNLGKGNSPNPVNSRNVA